jgi:pimeloyl-ACP methyl ester carboxylesterase
MAQTGMKDLIVLLPGIMGSVLQKDGVDLWAVSGRSILHTITSLGADLKKLVLVNDDHEKDDLGDGFRATALMPDAHIIPGLWKVDGYSKLSRMIREKFDVTPGNLDDTRPANFYEFPYDWRRDNRVAARLLKRLVDRQLPIWRQHRQDPEAKVILLAHSMGGLVARHYLEVMEGWADCRMLITMGTPYRGSVKALEYLANGYKNVLVDLTDAIRSFTSIYQLLPIYPTVKVDGVFKRVGEVDTIPHVDNKRAQDARKFHLDIVQKIDEHRADKKGAYMKNFQTVPIVGIRQPTLQTGELTMAGQVGSLVTGGTMPDIEGLPEDGDGTVPYTSAIPFEFSQEFRDIPFFEQHGSLQSSDRVLNFIHNLLTRARSGGALVEALGPEDEVSGIRLRADDLYLADEVVELSAEIINPMEFPDALVARIESVDGVTSRESSFQFDGDKWVLIQEGLPAGLYRVEVKARGTGEDEIKPVHGLFEVWRIEEPAKTDS